VPLLVLHLWMYRRRRAILRFQLLLDVVLVAVAGPALLTGSDLNPISTIQGRPPFQNVEWSTGTGYQPTQGDLVYQFHPWWDKAGQQLRRGELPRIEPGVGGGLPLMANGQTGLWAPVMLPVWLHGPERGTTIMAFWKIELAGLGAFLLMLRAWRLRWAAAAMGGVAWAGTPYLVGWLLVPLAWAVAALPWAWWAAWWLMRRRTPRWGAAAVGVGFGWLMGAGLHPETAAVICGSALLAALILHPRRWWRPVAVGAVAGVVAIALSWPTIGYIGASSRAALSKDGAANRDRMPWSMQRDLVRQIAVPASMGRPGTTDWRPSYPYAPGAAGVGGAVLALLAVGRIRRRWRRLAVAAGAASALGLVLLIRIPPLDTMLLRIPPLDHMTVPRFGVLIVPAAMVAAFALAAAPWRLLPADALLVIVSVVAAIMIGLLRRRRLAPALVAGELALLAVGINPTALETANPSRVTGVDGVLAPNLGARYGLRDLRASGPLRPEPFARLMGVLGEPPTILGGPLRRAPAGLCGAWGVGLALTPPGRELAGWEREYGDRDGAVWSNPLLLPEVRVVGTAIPEPDDALELLEVLEVMDFETTALVSRGAPIIDASAMSLELWRRTQTGLEAGTECDGPCLLVLAQPWAPGWRARIDGAPAPLVRTNIAGLGVVVPAGRHTVELDYRPWRWLGEVP